MRRRPGAGSTLSAAKTMARAQRPAVVDAIFAERRLAEVYDQLDHDRTDLDPYVAMMGELGVHSVLDIGCGTGTFACRLARRGIEVTGLDPAAASLQVACRKPGAHLVRWVRGEASAIPPMQVDAVTMTGNAAQVFLADGEWAAALASARCALRERGLLVFETRDPAREAWRGWTREQTFRRLEVPGAGALQTWLELTHIRWPLVSFLQTVVFETDGVVMVSESTLRFRDQVEVDNSLHLAGFVVEEVRDAPDRPDLELVFVARRALSVPVLRGTVSRH
jgi:ubiquinone/menaquinone biosynthesis C-methylase UbiE